MNREREWEGDGKRERDTKTMRSRRKKNSEDSGQEQGWVMGTQIEVEKGEVEGKKMCVFQSRRLQCANHKLCLEHNGVLHNCSIAAPPPPPMKARSLTPNMNTNKRVFTEWMPWQKPSIMGYILKQSLQAILSWVFETLVRLFSFPPVFFCKTRYCNRLHLLQRLTWVSVPPLLW